MAATANEERRHEGLNLKSDVGVDGEHLTQEVSPWKPVPGHIMTSWAEQVDPANPLPEYPRPQMKRANWLNLNGLWEYAVVPRDQASVSQYQGKILVPFCIESALSGVKRALLPEQRLWYRRSFSIPESWQDQKVLLHFGAVDWQASIYINGVKAGSHQGGYVPFSFDIGALIQQGVNEIVVAVWDPSDTHWQQKGKQRLKQHTIFYTPASGIWQTVWLEPVPQTYIKSFKLTPNIDTQTVQLVVEGCPAGDPEPLEVNVKVRDGETEISNGSGGLSETITIPVPNQKLWDTQKPFLYDLDIELTKQGMAIDHVSGYFGMRKFSIGPDSNGTQRLLLNNKVLFQHGLLDQGYWPDGIYTAPTDEALRFDVLMARRLGFNMIRKHIKVEPARWYYHCDREGLIVWQDMVNGGKVAANFFDILKALFGRSGKLTSKDTTRKFYRRSQRTEKASREDFESELKQTIDTLYNAPCIGLWVPFNESWGQFDAARISAWLKSYDPGRAVDHASGWFDQGAGDIQSHHLYVFKIKMPKIEGDRVLAITEYGGYCLETDGHVWHPNKSFGYRKFKDEKSFEEAYVSLISSQLQPLIEQGCGAAVYTQLTDVEIELNGLLTYDRKVVKLDEKRVFDLHRSLYLESGQ
jgi:beta-galactosidase/beta-glucuronidase